MDVTVEYNDIERFILLLQSRYNVIAPVARDGRFIFDLIDHPSKVSPEYDSTLLPPVKWIYPNDEALLEFDLKDATKIKEITESNMQALLFVHPCDVNAINIMDEILAEEPSDVNYLKRRWSTVIIGYECLGPCKENILCFDKSYHIAYSGFDLFFTDTGERYYVQVASSTGKEIIEMIGGLKKAGFSDKTELFRVRDERKARFKKSAHGNMDMLSHMLKEAYNDEIWNVEEKKCLSCGACNIVCPTCYCFDVVDEICPDMEKGTRYRWWDGCQLHGFCKVATGENFRKSAAERVRHRVFKKEVYLKKRFGRSGCVGCGRCIDHCIANISLIEIFNKVFDRVRESV